MKVVPPFHRLTFSPTEISLIDHFRCKYGNFYGQNAHYNIY